MDDDPFNFHTETRLIIQARYREGAAMLKLFDGCRKDNIELFRSLVLQDPSINVNWVAGAEDICLRICLYYQRHPLFAPTFYRMWKLVNVVDDFMLAMVERGEWKRNFEAWLKVHPNCILITDPHAEPST